DLSPFLFPDIRAPLTLEQEEQLLGALSSMHARFWDSPALDLRWLARPKNAIGLLDPRSGATEAAIADLPLDFGRALLRGWAAAVRNLPPAIVAALSRPAEEVARDWADLPRTLLHGDVKVANFALVGDGKVAAFDWAMMGAGPVSLDVGWYLAVNASRLAR